MNRRTGLVEPEQERSLLSESSVAIPSGKAQMRWYSCGNGSEASGNEELGEDTSRTVGIEGPGRDEWRPAETEGPAESPEAL
jgi:hypothetical protein